MQPCSRAAVQACSNAALQQCSQATLQACSAQSTALQLYSLADAMISHAAKISNLAALGSSPESAPMNTFAS